MTSQATEFDPEKFYLGKLCLRGHDWDGTGQSLRRKSTRACVDCGKEHSRRWRSQNREIQKEYSRRWRSQNREKVRERNRRWRSQNIEKARELTRRWRSQNIEKARELERNRYKQNIESHREKCRRWRSQNREKARELERRWRSQNIEKVREYSRRWKSQNIEKAREHSRRWKSQNPEAVKVVNHRRRARKTAALVIPYSAAELAAHFAKFDGCAYCGAPEQTVDHLFPLSDDLLAADALCNIVPACRRCNCSKNNRHPVQWYRAQPFYDPDRLQRIINILGIGKP